jgi:Zn-dependent M28 family amino/carboxypeptidase
MVSMTFHRSGALSPEPLPARAEAALADAFPLARRGELAGRLEFKVREIAFPRHHSQPEANGRAAAIVARWLSFLPFVKNLGGHGNILGGTREGLANPAFLLVSHYDSVAASPGADDNGAPLAAMAEAAAALVRALPGLPLLCLATNREEEGLLGSDEFVRRQIGELGLKIGEAHVLEMIGYRSFEPGSQRYPEGFPSAGLPDRGDFIALIGNPKAEAALRRVVSCPEPHRDIPAIGLIVGDDAGALPADIFRSDHVPFWDKGYGAVQWTDTAYYRNPNYHAATDTPDTLDYGFLASVTNLIAVAGAEFWFRMVTMRDDDSTS